MSHSLAKYFNVWTSKYLTIDIVAQKVLQNFKIKQFLWGGDTEGIS
jgi:hypothetical protein